MPAKASILNGIPRQELERPPASGGEDLAHVSSGGVTLLQD